MIAVSLFMDHIQFSSLARQLTLMSLKYTCMYMQVGYMCMYLGQLHEHLYKSATCIQVNSSWLSQKCEIFLSTTWSNMHFICLYLVALRHTMKSEVSRYTSLHQYMRNGRTTCTCTVQLTFSSASTLSHVLKTKMEPKVL